MMRLVRQAYDGVIVALAVLGAASLGFVAIAVCADVLMRNMFNRPFAWTSAGVEYIMLLATMAGSPWLVRTGGHVAITTFLDHVPGQARALIGRGAILACTLMSALIAWRAFVIAREEWVSRSMDIRSIAIPGWVAYVMMGIGFGLMASEFARLLAAGETQAGKGEH